MTDKEKIKKLFTELGIDFDCGEPEDYKKHGENAIYCWGGSNKIDGYTGFYTTFEFNDDDTLKRMGAWE